MNLDAGALLDALEQPGIIGMLVQRAVEQGHGRVLVHQGQGQAAQAVFLGEGEAGQQQRQHADESENLLHAGFLQ